MWQNMKYRVNDIFYSLQGEGHNAGRAAVFVRFSGCNLRCPFCDTDFSQYEEMTAEEICYNMKAVVGKEAPFPMVVLTGGEPTLQVDEELIDLMHDRGFRFVAMESNGIRQPPKNLDWLTLSPKRDVNVGECDELKVLFDGDRPLSLPFGVGWGGARYCYLQPMDTGDIERNKEITAACVDYIKRHPVWRLSLQTHKLVGFK